MSSTSPEKPGAPILRAPCIVQLILVLLLAGCGEDPQAPRVDPEPVANRATADPPPRIVAEGREIFRHDDFGNWRFWTDTLRLHELVAEVTPADALTLGLKVDREAVPPEVLEAVLADPALLEDPATTRALLALDAVVGLKGQVEDEEIVRLGITCGLCHSSVDDGVAPGIGRRVDGVPNRDLAVGTIISLAPGLPEELRAEYAAWPPGFYDPRFNVDGISDPVLIPPAYGLATRATYTGEGTVSYWNNYVAVTQMRGRGSFRDPRLGIAISVSPHEDEVRGKLPALRAYQRSLRAPDPTPGSFDPAAAARGEGLFQTVARCASCHVGPDLAGEGQLHDPDATGMDPTYAERSTTGRYRATPLRALEARPPYFHDGSAASLDEVVAHYDAVLGLGLTEGQAIDLVEYLRSL